MENKKKSFSQRIYMGGIIPNMLSVCAMYFYSMFIMQTSSDIMIRALWTMLILALPAQFIFAPFSNLLITKIFLKKSKDGKTASFLQKNHLNCLKKFNLFQEKNNMKH